MPNLAQAFDVLYRIMDKEWKNFLNFLGSIAKNQKSVILAVKLHNIRKRVVVMKKLLALLMAFILTFQLVTPVFAEEIEETQAATEAVEVETVAPVTEAPTIEPPFPETAAPEETSAPTEPQPTTEVTEATASTEETTEAATEPTEPTLDLLSEDENVIASGECGDKEDNLTWTLTKNGTLTISGTGGMQYYPSHYDSEISDYITITPWYDYREQITTLLVETGVTNLQNDAFSGCRNLTAVHLPESLDYIGSGVFENCLGLTSMVIPDAVYYIGGQAFSGCANLASVTLPDSLTSLSNQLFENCTSLKSINIPASVTGIDYGAFIGCTALTSIVIPGKAIVGWNAFAGCTGLETAVMLDGVSGIGFGSFTNCSALKTVAIPDTVASIGTHAFSGCSSLESVAIPGKVTVIEQCTFQNCANLKSVTIPETITSIGNSAFEGCSSLTGLTLPQGITRIADNTFYNCTSLKSLVIPKDVTYIGRYAFDNCAALTSLEIPAGVTEIGDGAFIGCSGLKGLVIPAGVTAIPEAAFSGCGNLTRLELPERITGIGRAAFSGCASLTRAVIPEGITGIAEDTFRNCANLESVAIPKTVTGIGDSAFLGCSRLTGVVIPEGVTRIEDYAFMDCASLMDIVIPGSVTSLGSEAFMDCSGLKSVVIPGSLERIEKGAFYGCALTSLEIPEGVVSIGDYAFLNNEQLTSVRIPRSVTAIGEDAFHCIRLKTAYYGGSKADWNRIQMGDNFYLRYANLVCDIVDPTRIEIRPADTTALNSGSKLTLSAWDSGKKAKVKWSLSEDSKAYATISSSGVLTAKAVSEVQNITVIATPTDGSPETRKTIQILPKITVKQAEKFNLFYGNGRAKLAITGGQVATARFIEPTDFVLEDSDGQFYIRLAEGASAKPKTKVTLEITLPGCDTPVRQSLTIATTNTAPKLKLNPTASIVNTTLTSSLTVETAILGTEDTLTVRSATKGVTASVDNGILTLTLDTPKTTTATVYLKGSDWAKEVKMTHKITVTDKKPTVKLSAKGKLDVLNPASEIVYTPKLSNATGTITDVCLEGQDANLFNAEVVDGLVHLKLAKSGENYATKKTYKVMPVVTLLGEEITGSTLSVKVTQSAMKLAKLPNRTVYQSQTAPLAVKLTVTSPASAEIGDVQLNVKTTAALQNALEAAGGIQADEAAVSFPAKAFAALKPGRYTVILDVTPANAASDTKRIQARFTLTVQK